MDPSLVLKSRQLPERHLQLSTCAAGLASLVPSVKLVPFHKILSPLAH